MVSQQEINLIVTGNRSAKTESESALQDLPSALLVAYSLTANSTGSTVNILLNTYVDHYVLLSDIALSHIPMNYLISPAF